MHITFEQIFGQAPARKFLGNAFENNRLAHAYLFIGAEGTGKAAMALEFAKALLCTNQEKTPCHKCADCRHIAEIGHPNLTLLFAYPKSAKDEEILAVRRSAVEQPYTMKKPWPNANISIDAIRTLKRDLGLKSHQGRNRVIIILDAHQMTAEATNALLKILEEPPEQTYFVLATDKPDKILQTVLSRCQHLRFNKLGIAEIERGLAQFTQKDERIIRQAARMGNGSLRRALELLDEDMQVLKEAAVEVMRGAFKSPSQSAVFAVELARKYDKARIRQILENLLLWLRDALLITNLEDEHAKKYMTNEDAFETLSKFVARAPQFDFHKAIREIETSINMIDRYVQPALVLTVMLNNLRALVNAQPVQKAA
ncbi:MAG: DNA polymerase III subunit delta' [bacterium]